MALVRFDVGQSADVLTPDENRNHLREMFNAWERSRAAGVKDFRFQAQGTIADGAVTIPSLPAGVQSFGTGWPATGPGAGDVWAVHRISVWLLTSSSDTLYIFRGQYGDAAGNPGNFLAQLTQASPFVTLGAGRVTLQAGEQIIITGSSLTSTGTLVINGEGVQAPAEMAYKVL
jgi:hypothetical protein